MRIKLRTNLRLAEHIKASAKVAFTICFISVSYLALEPAGMPLEELSEIFSYDKINHFVAFFVLSHLLFFCSEYSEKKSFIKVIVFLLLSGVAIEVFQGLTPTREFSFFDIIADLIGIIFGSLFAIKIQQRYSLLE